MSLAIYCILLVLLIVFGTPIGFSLLISGVVYILAFSNLDLMVIPQKMMFGLNSFTLLALPFFLILGELMARSGITSRLMNLATAMVGHIRGGLAQVNTVTSMLLAGVQGAAAADTAAVGSILIPAMKNEGYKSSYSAAITAASSVIGPLIPPSLSMVIYGSIANVSIGRLFLAGAAPGMILGLFLMTYSYIMAGRKGYSGKLYTFSKSKLASGFKEGYLTLLIPVIIVVGIVGGVFTPTESGAIATLVTLFLGIFVFKTIRRRELVDSIRQTVFTLGNILIIIAGAATFGWILTREGATEALTTFLLSVSDNPLIIMLIINSLMLICGCFIETIALIVMLTPIFLPIVTGLGFDPVHFGAIMVMNLTLGMATPPLGICMFMASDIAKIPIEETMKDLLPLYIPLGLALMIIILFPQITMYLPNLLMPLGG